MGSTLLRAPGHATPVTTQGGAVWQGSALPGVVCQVQQAPAGRRQGHHEPTLFDSGRGCGPGAHRVIVLGGDGIHRADLVEAVGVVARRGDGRPKDLAGGVLGRESERVVGRLSPGRPAGVVRMGAMTLTSSVWQAAGPASARPLSTSTGTLPSPEGGHREAGASAGDQLDPGGLFYSAANHAAIPGWRSTMRLRAGGSAATA